MSRFRFVEDHQDTYEVKRLCELVECSRSGFYAWQGRPPCARAIEDAELLEQIRVIHTESRCTYGAPRVHGQLRRRGVRVGCKRVARLMRTNGLMGVHKRKWRRRRPDIAPAPDRLNRDFTAARPNQRWVADITEFPTREGKLHVAGVRDLCHRGMVGWAMGPHPDADLVVDALVMALGRATPDDEGLVHHSDKGGAYVSGDFCALADIAGLQVSFGSTPATATTTPRWRPCGRPSSARSDGSEDRSSSTPATRPGSTCSSSSRSSTTASDTRPSSTTAPRPSSQLPSAPDHRNPVSTRPGQGHITSDGPKGCATCEATAEYSANLLGITVPLESLDQVLTHLRAAPLGGDAILDGFTTSSSWVHTEQRADGTDCDDPENRIGCRPGPFAAAGADDAAGAHSLRLRPL